EKDEIALRFAQGRHGLGPVAALADELDVGVVLEEGAQAFAAQRFVIDDQRSDAPHRVGSSRVGRTWGRRATKEVPDSDTALALVRPAPPGGGGLGGGGQKPSRRRKDFPPPPPAPPRKGGGRKTTHHRKGV